MLSALPIQGTAGDDTITISQDATGVAVVTGSGSDFYPGDFSTIEIDGLAGSDLIRLTHSVFADTIVYGGSGSDTIFDATVGSGQIYGGDGDDLLVAVGGGADLLVGGAGTDSFWCDGADVIGDADFDESLRNIHVIQEFYQPYTTDPQSPDYVSLEIDGQNLRDPNASGYASFVSTPLFVDGPQYDDAVQGSVGDCYFVSALASLADTIPDVIEQAVAPLGDGTYAVRFYRSFEEHYIRVDADLPASGGSPKYAKLGADGEIWCPLIEKAYAYFRYGQNSYASLDSGWPSAVYSEVTASDIITIWPGLPDNQLTDFISSHLVAGHAMAAPSKSGATSPITASHSYMIKSMRAEGSTTYLTLYNPWGSLLDVTLAEFKSNFGSLTASLSGDNHLPVAVDDQAVTDIDTPVVIDVLSNDWDPDGDPLSIKSVGWPAYGFPEDNGNGTITYTPDPGFQGIVTFTYVVSDGNGGLDQSEVTVQVGPPINQPPIANPDFLNTQRDTPLTFPKDDLVVNDTDSNGDSLVAVDFTRPAHGTLAENGDATWTYEPESGYVGQDSFTYTVSDSNGGEDVGVVTVDVIQVTLRVIGFSSDASGFSVQFNRAPDWGVINLYGSALATASPPSGDGVGGLGQVDYPPPDLTVVLNDTLDISGSLTWDADTCTLRFTRTGGILADGQYTVTLVSGADAFCDVQGYMLDGNGDGTAGDDYMTTFTVDPFAEPVVSLPDFIRGPGQSVDVPASSAGLPVRINDATGVTGMQFTLAYDPTMLNVAGASLGPAVPADWALTEDLTTPGTASFTLSGPTPLTGADVELVVLSASVPVDAEYRSGQVIRLVDLLVNNGALPALADSAFHKVAHLGDTSGNQTYGGLDATFISRVATGLDSGFDAYATTDPVIVADVTGNGSLSSLDASTVAAKAVGLTEPAIPDLPAGTVMGEPTGPDPQVSIDTGYTANRSETLVVPVQIDDATGLMSADLTITYDTDLLNLDNSDVALGDLLSGWGMAVNIMDDIGEARITAYTLGPAHPGGGGNLLELSFHVPADAPAGVTVLDVEGSLNEGLLVITDVDGDLTVPIGVTVTPDAGNTDAEGAAMSFTSSLVGETGTAAYLWTVTKDGQAYSVSGNTGAAFTFTPDDGDATYVVTLDVTDSDSPPNSGQGSVTVPVSNVAPTIAADNPSVTVDEGQLAANTGTFDDVGDDTVNLTASVGTVIDNGNGTWSWSFQTSDGPDDGQAVTITATDSDGAFTETTFTLAVNNVAPVPQITGLPGGPWPEYSPLNLSLNENDPSTTDTFTYAWEVTKGGQPFASGTERDFSFTPDGGGTYSVTVTATDDDGAVGVDSEDITVTEVTFRVSDFSANPSGFDVTFNRPADMDGINLYGGFDAADPVDLTVTGPGGTVVGSLVWSAATNAASWVATGGALAAGEYTVSLASRADAWRDVRSGELLDGDGDGTTGDNYVTAFTIDPITSPVVSLPDFTRGPDQPVDVPTSSAGLPVRVSDGSGVNSVQIQIDYDWGLLNVTAADLAAGVPGDWALTVADLSVDGRAVLDASGTTSLPAGPATVFDLTANVPITAEYGACQIIRIGSLLLSGGAVTGTADAAVHKVAFLGDATGNRGYSGLDAALIARNSVQLDDGFDAYQLVDPVIIADVTGDGTLSALDAAEVARKAVALPSSTIPDLPASNSPTLAAPGIDPVVTVGADLLAGPGGQAHAAVSIDSPAGLKAFDFTVTYDTVLLDLSNSDVSLTDLTGSGWNLTANVNDSEGRATLSVWSTTALPGDPGDLLDLAFHVPGDGVSGTSVVDLGGQLNEGQLEMTDIDGSVVVDADAPLVSDVRVAASSWSQTFLDSLGGVGFAIPTGPDQLSSLSWAGIDRVSVTFSEDVTLSQDSLHVYGVNVPEYPISDFRYDGGTRTATWTLSQPVVEGDALRLVLSDVVTDQVGNLLDGDWVDAASMYPSGDGTSGGQFEMEVNVLPSDVDGDGTVGTADLSALASTIGQPAAGAAIRADTDGSGYIGAADYIALKRSFGRSLPQATQTQAAAPVSITTEAESVVQDVLADTVASQPIVDAASIQPLEQLAAWKGQRDHERPSSMASVKAGRLTTVLPVSPQRSLRDGTALGTPLPLLTIGAPIDLLGISQPLLSVVDSPGRTRADSARGPEAIDDVLPTPLHELDLAAGLPPARDRLR